MWTIETINTIAQHWLDGIAAQSVYAAIAATFVFAVLKLWRPKHPVWAVALWSLVLIRFVMPVDVAAPWTARSVAERGSTAWLMQDYPAIKAAQRPLLAAEKSPVLMLRPPSAAEISGTALPAINWQIALLGLWALGASLLLTRLVLAYVHLNRILSRATPLVSDPLLQATDTWRVALGVRRAVTLLTSPDGTGAFTTRVFKPVIVLPASLVNCMTHADLTAVIGHEMAHIRGLDSLWLQVEQLLRALFFFHPAIWLATVKLDEAREALRDLDMLNAGPVTPNAYAITLLSVLKSQRNDDTAPLLAVAMGRTAERLKQRLLLLKISRALKHPSRWLIAGSTLAIAAVVLPMAHSTPEKTKSVAGTAVTPQTAKAVQPGTGVATLTANDAGVSRADKNTERALSPSGSSTPPVPDAPADTWFQDDMQEALADIAESEQDTRQDVMEAEQALVEARADARAATGGDWAIAQETIADARRDVARERSKASQKFADLARARRDLETETDAGATSHDAAHARQDAEHARAEARQARQEALQAATEARVDAAQAMREAQQDAAHVRREAHQDAAQARRDAEQARRDAEQAMQDGEALAHTVRLGQRRTDTKTLVVIEKNVVRCGSAIRAGSLHRIILNGRDVACTSALTDADKKIGYAGDDGKAAGWLGARGVMKVVRQNGNTSVHVYSNSSRTSPASAEPPVPPTPPAAPRGSGAWVKKINLEAVLPRPRSGADNCPDTQTARLETRPAKNS
jgi:beta-lactamase regulating signal transducer with metallopeptidase domain